MWLIGIVAYELNLTEGLRFERRIFHGLFATNDQKEGDTRAYVMLYRVLTNWSQGMAAFAEKRKPQFTHS